MRIGEKIKEVFEANGIKLTDFADQIGTVRQNVYRIFERDSVDADLLVKISKVLHHDFFQYYRQDSIASSGMQINLDLKSNEVSLLTEELNSARKEIDYLKKIIALREEEKNLIESKYKTQQELLEAIITNLKEKEKNYLLKIKSLEEK